MSQIRRLSKEVKEEVHDIKRIKGEVTHMKVLMKILDLQKCTCCLGGDYGHQAP